MNNKMEKLAKEFFNKELEEEFEIEGREGVKYKFTEKGVIMKNGDPNYYVLHALLTGELKIKWKPENKEMCYSIFSQYPKPQRLLYYNESMADRLMFKRGLVLRTEEEATEKMKDMGWLEE